MLTEDYLIRMINLAIAALLRIVGLKKAGDYQEARLLIDLTFERLLGLRANIAKNLDDDRLYYLLTRQDKLDTRRLAVIAELFHQEGDIAAAQNRLQESRDAHTRALRYNLEVLFHEPENEPLQIELRAKVDVLLQKLDLASLPSDTLWPLAGYYEESGAYGQAETILQMLVGRPEIRTEIRAELLAFYDRLVQKAPADLEAGGLSLAKIRQHRMQWGNPE